MTKTILVEVSNFGHCNLFDIWCLEFGVYLRFGYFQKAAI